MSAFATSIKIRAKIDEKSHVFWNVDFECILGWFWEGFGRPKSSFFLNFCTVFALRDFERNLEAQNLENKTERASATFAGLLALSLLGEDLGEGIHPSGST